MANKGITLPSGKTGNQYVTVNVKFPKSLDSEQKELISKFDDIESKKSVLKSVHRRERNVSVISLSRS